jgi:hypothetical protein
VYTHFKYKFSHFVRFSDIQIISQKFLAINQAVAQCYRFLLWTLPHSTRAKVNHVLSSREGKGGGDIDKVLGPPLRGGKRRSLGAKVNQRPIYST